MTRTLAKYTCEWTGGDYIKVVVPVDLAEKDLKNQAQALVLYGETYGAQQTEERQYLYVKAPRALPDNAVWFCDIQQNGVRHVYRLL